MTLSKIQPVAQANGGAELGWTNPILNGDMRINQRAVSSVSYASVVTNFAVDRVRVDAYTSAFGTTGGGTAQQVTLATPLVTPGATFMNALRITPNASWAKTYVYQNIEDVNTFNGQTVTISFYARAAANWTIPTQGRVTQGFGSGGSADTEHFDNSLIGKVITTSWQRFSYTVTLSSTAGKTVGANNLIGVNMIQGADTSGVSWIEFTGFKMEIGTVATPFIQRPLGTELALCQRYYYQVNAGSDSYCQFGMGRAYSGTAGNGIIPFAVPMRAKPTFNYLGSLSNYDFSPTAINPGAVDAGNTHMTVGMGFTSITSGSVYIIGQNAASTPCGFTFSAEL